MNLQPPGYEPGELPTAPSRINAPEALSYPEPHRKAWGIKPVQIDRQGMTPDGRQSISTREEERRILTPVPVYTIPPLNGTLGTNGTNFIFLP